MSPSLLPARSLAAEGAQLALGEGSGTSPPREKGSTGKGFRCCMQVSVEKEPGERGGGATPMAGEESEPVHLADPIPNVVSMEPRPEEGPRVRQRGWLSSSEIWRPQLVQLVHACQRVRNQSLKTPEGPGSC